MKPVTHHMTPFTPDRIRAIRLAREIAIGEARMAMMNKGKRKKGTSAKSKGRVRKAILDPKARQALANADPELKAFLEANL